MISFEVFENVTYEITDTFPEVFFRELNGGVMVREYSRLHPAALDHDLFVLGEYTMTAIWAGLSYFTTDPL